MTSQQMDLFEYLKTKTRTESPEPMLAILEAVEGSKSKQFKVSKALESVADVLAGEPEPKDKRFNQFAHRAGRSSTNGKLGAFPNPNYGLLIQIMKTESFLITSI